MHQTHSSDVLVVGGGPAGATTAALLARQGWTVNVVEKSRHPRYHIGESLMPYCWYSLQRLGVLDQMAGFTKKYSVQFVTMDGKQSRPFYFFQHHDHPSSTTWQVVRSQFDEILINQAIKDGAVIHSHQRAHTPTYGDDGYLTGVESTADDGTTHSYRARITIDATGREGFLAVKEKWRVRDPHLNKISIWTYYKDALRDPGIDAGSTTVAYLPGKGWFWYIPLPDNITSIGIVAERDYLYRDGLRDPRAIMDREIPENKWLQEHLAPATQIGEYWVTGDYSYRSRFCATDGAILAGDAFAFLDPVFSSGVFLALKSGEMAADAVHSALTAGDVSAARFQAYGTALCSHIESMRKLVTSFYQETFSFAGLVKAHPDLRGPLTDCLIGNLQTDFTDLFAGMAELAVLPAELDYGMATHSRSSRAVA